MPSYPLRQFVILPPAVLKQFTSVPECARSVLVAQLAMSLAQKPVSQASLLGLPKELRLEIYQQVFAARLDCLIVDFWKHEHSSEYGFKSVPLLHPDTRLLIPWVNLMLTCKSLAVELSSVMSENIFLANDQNTTWSLQLQALRPGGRLGSTTWARIPCPPQRARILEASFNIERGFRPWGDGGPAAITSALYQTLNFVVHCGASFDPKRQMRSPMQLQELRIKLESRESDDRPPASFSRRETNPETILYALGSLVGQIVNTGVLRGSVDMISVSSADKTLSWTPQEVQGEGKIPEYWDRYGFEWGMSLYEPAST